MTKNELLTIIAFIDSSRHPAVSKLGIEAPDPVWAMVLHLLRRHFQNKLVTISNLAQASGVPYGTAMRRIGELIDHGLIVRRPRTSSGKSFSLHPSKDLLVRFQEFAWEIKGLVGQTFGLPNDGDGGSADFFFGASYLAARIIPAPSILSSDKMIGGSIRILTDDDPVFLTLERLHADLESLIGARVELDTVELDQLRAATLSNAERPKSRYDIVGWDLPWLGEFATSGVLLPLNEFLGKGTINQADFHPGGWEAVARDGDIFGIPIEPMPEILVYRSDRLAAVGLTAPTTTHDLLTACAALNEPARGRYGIAWCAGRGTPLGHTFIQTMAAHGRPIINLPPASDGFQFSDLPGEAYRPMLDTPEARETAEYLVRLLEFSPPDILSMEWNRSVDAFSQGRVAMAYAWTCRAAGFDPSDNSEAQGNVGYAPHPAGLKADNISPIGGFALGIPANLDEQRVHLAWRVIAWLTSPEMMKLYVQNGSLVSPRFSVSNDPEVRAVSPIIGAVDEMARLGQLQHWPRPPVPEFSEIVQIAGTELHHMLTGELKPHAALACAQQRIDQLMRANGHY